MQSWILRIKAPIFHRCLPYNAICIFFSTIFRAALCTVQCNLPIVYIVDFSSKDFDDSIVAGISGSPV